MQNAHSAALAPCAYAPNKQPCSPSFQVLRKQNLAVLLDNAFSVVKAYAKRRFRIKGFAFPFKVPSISIDSQCVEGCLSL